MVITTLVPDLRRYRRRSLSRVGVMIHRCGIDLKWQNVLGYSGPVVMEAFLGNVPKWIEVAEAVGHRAPYNFTIGGDLGPPELDGVVWQHLPLDCVGPHARRASADFVSIGLIGDPRMHPVSPAQHRSLLELCLKLGAWNPVGHGEVKGAHNGSKAPGHENWCPGFDLAGLRGELKRSVGVVVG